MAVVGYLTTVSAVHTVCIFSEINIFYKDEGSNPRSRQQGSYKYMIHNSVIINI